MLIWLYQIIIIISVYPILGYHNKQVSHHIPSTQRKICYENMCEITGGRMRKSLDSKTKIDSGKIENGD